MTVRGVQSGTAAPKQTKTTSGVGKPKRKGVKQVRKITYKYFVDCSIPVEDGIFDLDHFVSSNYAVALVYTFDIFVDILFETKLFMSAQRL
jgi:hypothetical protein